MLVQKVTMKTLIATLPKLRPVRCDTGKYYRLSRDHTGDARSQL